MIETVVFSQFFVGLFATVNPLGIISIYVSLTAHMSPQKRKQTANIACFTIAIIIIVSMLAGQFLLDMFSISISSFRIAGGLLLLTIAMTMISGKLGDHKQNKQEQTESTSLEQLGVVPIAMPLMAGPGTISMSIVYASRHPNAMDVVGLCLTAVLFAFFCWGILRASPALVRFIGQTGLNVITRIMGLILGALGIEFITGGLKVLLPGLAG